MNYLTPEQAAFAQRDFIYNLFAKNVNVDANGNAGKGQNTDGKLQAVASLGRKSIWPAFNSLPFLGVQLKKQDESLSASNRKHEIDTTIWVGISVNVVASPTGTIQVDDAYDILENLIDDGNGNGVGPLLRANSSYNLGRTLGQPNASMQYLPTILYDWDNVPQGKGPAYFAYAIITVKSKVFLNIGQ